MTEQKPIPAVAIDSYLPCTAMTPASAERCVAEKAAVMGLVGMEGFQALRAVWRERERALLSARVTEAPDVLAGNRRKARVYRLVRAIIEQVSATGEKAEKRLRGEQAEELPQAAIDEFAVLLDMLAHAVGAPTFKEREAEAYANGGAARLVEKANAVAAAVAHPGWRVIVGFLAGLSWAHWLMLGEGVGDDAEHQNTIAVIAAMLHSAQDVLLQGRKAEQWFKEQAGETA